MKITIPTNRSWQVSYFGDLFSNIVENFDINLHYSQGKVVVGQYLYPHTVTSDIASIHIATDFVYSNADNTSGTLKYWSANEKLYKQQNVFTTPFAADTVTLSPTSLVDSDLIKWGITQGFNPLSNVNNGIDILVVSTPTDLSLLDYAAANSFTWINNWWTSDLVDSFSSTTVAGAGLVSVTVASTANYNTGDRVLISNTGFQQASYTGNVTTLSASTVVTGISSANLQTMAVGSPISGTNIPSGTTINGILSSSSISISLPATGSGTVSATWSDLISRTIDGEWTITVVDGTHFSLNSSSTLNQFGGSTGISFTGNIERTFNHTTSFTFLAQLALKSGVPHVLLPFGEAPVLFITDGNWVHSVSGPGSFIRPTQYTDVQYKRLVFKDGYTINWCVATSLKIYFGLMDKRGSSYPSLVEEYDPFNEQVRETVIQNGSTMGFLVENNVHIIDIKGNLRAYNGTTFDTYSQLPTVEIDGGSIALPHRNGFFVSENRINFLLPSGSYYNDGWWTYELDTKRLYHQGSPVTSKVAQTTFGSTFGDSFGAFFSVGFNIALAGVSTFVSVGGSSQTGIFITPNFGISETPGYNPIGHLTLGKIPSAEIDSVWRNFLVKYNPVLDRIGLQTGTIVGKYKTSEYPHNGTNLSGTWVNATTFTTPQSARVDVGAEMTVTEGQASGASFHIVAVLGSTVTITDEGIGFVPSGAFAFNMDNFFRVPQDATDNTQNWSLFDLTNTTMGEWLQIKLETRGFFSIEEVQVGIAPNLEVEPEQTGGQYR